MKKVRPYTLDGGLEGLKRRQGIRWPRLRGEQPSGRMREVHQRSNKLGKESKI